MKHVEYFGATYQVPDETVAIATDRSGHIDCFSDVPVPVYAVWLGNRIAKLGRPAIVEPHWKDSLMLIEDVMCEYCEEYRKPLDKQDNFSVWMLGSDMVVRHSFGQTLVPIHYCPMCGKKLSAQEVEPCPTQPE